MTPEARLKQIAAQAETLRRKAMDTPGAFTEADAEEATTIAKERATLTALVERANSVAEALHKATEHGGTYSSRDEGEGRQPKFASRGGVPISQGEKAKAHTDHLMKALAAAAPTIGGPSVSKALVSSGAVTADFDGRIISDPAAAFSILAAVNDRQVDGAAGTYLQQTVRTNNAATVVPGALKPISAYSLEPADWKIATIAHLSQPISLQWLEDYPALETFLAQQLAYGLDEAIADFILNGGTAEDGSTVTGILNTSGIVQTAFSTNKLLTIRKAIGELDATGVTATGIIMNPADWESIETLTTTNGEFLLPLAPQKSVERVLWNTPVTLAAGIPAGEAVVGDLSSVSVLHRNSQRLEWSNAMSDTSVDGTPAPRDLFRRNEVVFRNEIRVGLELLSIPSLRVADLTAA